MKLALNDSWKGLLRIFAVIVVVVGSFKVRRCWRTALGAESLVIRELYSTVSTIHVPVSVL